MSDAFKARIAQLSPQQLQLLALDLRSRLDRINEQRKEPIAVVGMGCRFPGADNPRAFWELLRRGEDLIREVPSDRWNVDAFYDPDPDVRGRMATRWGGFIDRVREFDPEFFGIAPREAHSMDPQQRLLLEVAWEALEDAGLPPESLRGSRTGVFVGLCNGDYFQICTEYGFGAFDTYLATGTAHSVASGRLSYVLGLEGPAITLDTACSSSLIAVHLAVRSIRNGESRMAIAAGVNLVMWPGGAITMSAGRMLAPDGRCKTFDATGDGFVRGEGCGVVVLKRLSDALADGDRVLAVIRGSAANQDGRSNGLTAPNGRSQTTLITDALADADVQPAAISYVETHGTGTPLGDPIELHALGAALTPGRALGDDVVVGSVKTNIGHLEGAAGMAGLIKTILMLRAKEIPPSIHFAEPNPYIDWASIPVRVAKSLAPWQTSSGRRIAGVSSFGFSGSNAHIIVEEAPAKAAPARNPRAISVLPISARTESALREVASRYDALLDGDIPLDDVALTAGAGRTHFEYRAALVGRTREEIRAQLRELASDSPDATAIRGQVASATPPRVAFLYSGQGAQFVGMGASLYRTEPVFRAAIDRCARILDPIFPAPLLDVIHSAVEGDRRIHEAPYTQAAILSLQFALTELWRSWGVVPDAVMGHSAGEFAAAVTAGVISIDDALPLIVERWRLMTRAGKDGAMLAVFATEEALRAHLARVPTVVIGAFNGPDSLVLSGPRVDIDRIGAALVAAGIETRALEIATASHSVLMEPVLDEFERAVARATLHAPERPLISNLTGEIVGAEIATTSYWRRHLRQPVRFADGMNALVQSGARVFVEIGPHPTLVSIARRYHTGTQFHWVAPLRRDRDDVDQIAEALGGMYAAGASIDWKGVYAGTGASKASLPTYPFERESYWIDLVPGITAASVDAPRASLAQAAVAGLPGRRTDVARGPVVFDGSVSLDEYLWLADHRIGGVVVAPAPLFVDVARAAAIEGFEFSNPSIDDFAIETPLGVPETGARRVQTLLSPASDGSLSVEIVSQHASGGWVTHATCTVRDGIEFTRDDVAIPTVGGMSRVDVAEHYSRAEAFGVAFGPALRRMAALEVGSDVARGTVDLLAGGSASRTLHPAVVDGCLHVLGACLRAESDAFLMVGAERVRLATAPIEGVSLDVVARVRNDRGDDDERIADVVARDEAGRVVLAIDGVMLRRARSLRTAGADQIGELLYEIEWRAEGSPSPARSDALAGQHVLVVGTRLVPASLGEAISAAGGRVTSLALSDGSHASGADSLETTLATRLDAIAVDLPSRVVFVARIDNDDSINLDSAIEEACRGALAISRELVARSWKSRLTFVTSTAIGSGDARGVASEALAGYARSFANEHPKLFGGVIDAERLDELTLAGALVAEIVRVDEPHVVLTEDARRVPRLVRVPSIPARDCDGTLRGDATYVVTGALGGIGRKLLPWLVERGARHLALLMRRDPSTAETAFLDELRASGAELRIVRAVLANGADVARALGVIRAEMPAIAGVFHVAGIYNDAIIERMEWPRFASVFEAKTLAAWHLDRHTRRDRLEHFVMFASGASFLGPVALSNYAAANAALGAIARLRRREGFPALSIDWGPWSGTGMAEAVGTGRHGQWSQGGLSAMSTDIALGALGRLMARSEAEQVAVLPIDWRVFRASATGRGPLYAELAPAAGVDGQRAPKHGADNASSNGKGAHGAPFDVDALATLTAEERDEYVAAYLRGEVARELGVAVDRLSLVKPLNALGLDSLMAVQLRNRIQSSLDVTIPMSRFIDGSTLGLIIGELRAMLESALRASNVLSPPDANGEMESDLAQEVDVASLSDNEVECMLAKLLAEGTNPK